MASCGISKVCVDEIEELGLQDVVTLHGFVPAEDLEAALASAHLAINLRFPTMGEASVSQLQIWDHALPSLVTRVGWYATLPQETVAFVRPEHEIIDIQAHLRAFLDDPGRYAQMGEDGRRYLQTYHTPGAYVQAIIDAVRDAEAFRPDAMAHDMARRVGQEMRRWTNLPAPDVASYLWGHVVGSSQTQAEMRKPIEGIDYRHVEALKSMREELSEQVKRLQQQLSTGLQAVRRAASEECYTPDQQQGVPFRSPPSQAEATVPSLLTAASMTPVEATPPSPRDDLALACQCGFWRISDHFAHSPSLASRHGRGGSQKALLPRRRPALPIEHRGARHWIPRPVLSHGCGEKPGVKTWG